VQTLASGKSTTITLNNVKSAFISETFDMSLRADSSIGFLVASASATRTVDYVYYQYWHRGTYSTVQQCIEDHYGRHALSISGYDIIDFLINADSFRSAVVQHITMNTVIFYYVVGSPATIPPLWNLTGRSYEHRLTKNKIWLVDNGTYQIYSYVG